MDDQRTDRKSGKLLAVANIIGIAIYDGGTLLIALAATIFLGYHRIWLPSIMSLAVSALLAFNLWDDWRIERTRKK
jgi:hypothetical protein